MPAKRLTPKTPRSMPRKAFKDIRVRCQTALMAIAQIGAVALRIDSKDAEMVCAAYANKKNGSAELNNPRIKKCLQ
jgi:hypothetical protein